MDVAVQCVLFRIRPADMVLDSMQERHPTLLFDGADLLLARRKRVPRNRRQELRRELVFEQETQHCQTVAKLIVGAEPIVCLGMGSDRSIVVVNAARIMSRAAP